jgi:sugar/nucleoside kinase (ribokinase family)
MSGGSAANTIAALASLGGGGAFIGKVRDDQLGAIFRHDIRSLGITFDTEPAADGLPTARCLILVTPDAHRTMQTFLGVSGELGPEDVDDAMIAASKITYLEGYLWDRPRAKAAFVKAGRAAQKAGRTVALSLSVWSTTTSTYCSPTRTRSSRSIRNIRSTAPCRRFAATAGWRC